MKRLRLWALALVLLAGCATLGDQGKIDQLKEAVEAYNHAYRWKNYDSAVLLLQPDLRSPFLAAHEEDESSLQVEDLKIRRVELQGKKRAVIHVRARYMMLPSVSVKKKTLVQYWAMIGGQWLMESEENSIRKIDPLAHPKEPTEKPLPEGSQEGQTELEVTPPKEPKE
jgi:hypothetical protein